jgi:hypothetical protein
MKNNDGDPTFQVNRETGRIVFGPPPGSPPPESALEPSLDNEIDLGSNNKFFKDIYLAGDLNAKGGYYSASKLSYTADAGALAFWTTIGGPTPTTVEDAINAIAAYLATL